MISKLNCLSFPVMKTWMSHGMVGYAKWVNFEHLYLLNVMTLRSTKSHSNHFFDGQTCMESCFKSKGMVPKSASIQMDLSFEEPFLVPSRTLLVPGRTLSTEGSTWNPKWFYMGPKRVILWGQPNNRFGSLSSKSVA